MFKKGFLFAKKLSLKDRRIILINLRKHSDNVEDMKRILSDYIEFPNFSSIYDEYNFFIGFMIGISYITREDLEDELIKLKKILNILDIPDLDQYYITANRYFDKNYGKERVVVSLNPKKGALVKAKTRVPKIKDFEKLKEIIEEFKDLYALYKSVEGRRFRFFEKIS